MGFLGKSTSFLAYFCYQKLLFCYCFACLVFSMFCWRRMAIFNYFPKNCLEITQETLKLDNISSIRYRIIWSHHVPNVKQHVRLCLLQLLIYCKNQKKLLFFADGSKIIHSVILFFRFFKIENCSEKQVLPKRAKAVIKRCSLK